MKMQMNDRDPQLREVLDGLRDGRFSNGDRELFTPLVADLLHLLSNVYLHYVLDLWFERVVTRWAISNGRPYRDSDRFRQRADEARSAFGLTINLIRPSFGRVEGFGHLLRLRLACAQRKWRHCTSALDPVRNP